MWLLRDILYGLISGFSEFLPVSSLGHQALLMRLFGWDSRDPLRDLLVHIAIIIALLTCCGSSFARLNRERRLRTRRRQNADQTKDYYDLRLIRSATVPLILGMLLYFSTAAIESSLAWVAFYFCMNGVIMIIPDHMRGSTKDSKHLTGLDSILLGVFGALSVFPGISRTGAMSAYATVRGAGRQHSLNWVLLLSLPALVVLCGFDLVSIFAYSVGTVTFLRVIGYIFTAISAYFGAYLSIILIRFLTFRTGFSGFAYYSFGAALFTMILYLIT